MKIAIEGCCHGELDKIYEILTKAEERQGIKIDLLICCGDFQAVRNSDDMMCMAVPPKYRQIGGFYQYYSGAKKAPFLTIFVGGNHEATNHLWELSYGGWVAPNIYYMGNAGVVQYGGVRIGGLSGIFKAHHYHQAHFEGPPYSEDTMRSAYHVRSCDVYRFKQLKGHLDIMVSHDWPLEACHHGNTEQLLRKKPHFRGEVETNTLGSPPAEELLQLLKPSYWFSAHLHVKFAALYHHGDGSFTKFLALDKCLPNRRYLQILDVPSAPGPFKLERDKNWLAVVRLTEPFMLYTRSQWFPPSAGNRDMSSALLEEEEETVSKLFGHDFTVPLNFSQTVPPHNPHMTHHSTSSGPTALENPQTADLCHRLGIDNPFKPGFGRRLDQRPTNQKDLDGGVEGPLPPREEWAPLPPREEWANPDEIALVEDDPVNTGDGEEDGVTVCSSDAAQQCTNPDEIHIDSDLDGEEGGGSSQEVVINYTEPETGPWVGPGVRSDTGPESADPGTGPSVDPGTGPSIDPGTGPSIDPGTGPRADPGTGPSVDPGTGPSVDPGTGPRADPGTGLSVDPGAEPSVDPGTEPSVDPGTGPSVDPGTGPSVDPGTGPSIDPGTGPRADPGTGPRTGPESEGVCCTDDVVKGDCGGDCYDSVGDKVTPASVSDACSEVQCP